MESRADDRADQSDTGNDERRARGDDRSRHIVGHGTTL
jgi:hypothetical protein